VSPLGAGLRKAAGVALAALGLVALWALAAAALARPFLPSPSLAMAAFVKLASDGTLGTHAGASASRVMWALAASFVPAAALGLAAGRSHRLDAVVSPLVYILHPLPKAAFLPIILLVFGLGEASKIFLVGLIVFSQILVSARDSARRVPRQLIDSVRSLGASKLELAALVVVPAALPDLLTSLRVSLGTAVAVLGSLQAHLALHLLLGLQPDALGRVVTFDAVRLAFGGFGFAGSAEPESVVPFIATTSVTPADLVPIYLRPSEAELKRRGVAVR